MGIHTGYVCIRFDSYTNLTDLHGSCFILMLFLCLSSGSLELGVYFYHNTQHNNCIPWSSRICYLCGLGCEGLHITEKKIKEIYIE